MDPENLDIGSLADARRKAIVESLREITLEELKQLAESLFTYLDHPWREPYDRFLAENPSGTFFHANTGNGAEVIYCRSREKGLWYVPRKAIGALQEKGLQALREIVDAR